MKMVARLLTGAALLLSLGFLSPMPLMAADGVLQCVPYARSVSGIRIHGDAWTWWNQAAGRYARGGMPRPGAVIALANTSAMPLGHVAVVSRILDERHILLRHANWSAPGMIENDVLALDSSPNNDWSQVRIWWGQTQVMGARNNPVNGFIYPDGESIRSVVMAEDDELPVPGRRMLSDMRPARSAGPRLAVDPGLFRASTDTMVTTGRVQRTLGSIIRQLKREARLP